MMSSLVEYKGEASIEVMVCVVPSPMYSSAWMERELSGLLFHWIIADRSLSRDSIFVGGNLHLLSFFWTTAST